MRLLRAALAAVVLGLGAIGVAAQEPPTSRPVPTLLVSHLRVADQACLEAAARLPGVTPDGSPRWAASELDKVKTHLLEARRSTVDPKEQIRLEHLAGEAQSLRRSLRSRSDDAPLRLARLRSEIRRMTDEIQRRVELARPEPVPVTRPPLGP